MGTFIKALQGFLKEQSAKVAEAANLVDKKEVELKHAISQLQISDDEKTKLKEQVAELRKLETRSSFL